MSMLLVIIIAIVCGALVGFGTELTMKDRARARRLPGGSLTAGIIIGVGLSAPDNKLVSTLVGGVFGLIGWLLYRSHHRVNKTE